MLGALRPNTGAVHTSIVCRRTLDMECSAAGPFDNTAHMAALLDRTASKALRHCLLKLVEALLIPRSASISDQASQAARSNATAFVEAGGVMLAVDLVAGLRLLNRPTLRHVCRRHCTPSYDSG